VEFDYSSAYEGVCIPAAWVRAAVDLAARVVLPQGGPRLAALDIAAEGGNKSVLGFRRGVVVESPILSWSGVSGTYTATKAREECERRGVGNLNYDAGGGYGEPVAQLGREGGAGFTVRGLNGGEGASLAAWPDGRLSRDKFINARAEWWWRLRERVRKAWEFVEEGTAHPPNEMISIPNDASLIAELSLPLAETAETGKVRIESKAHMRLRGVASPDFADMLAYLFVEAYEFGFAIS
jgi:phage terminase large subunit